MREPTPEDIARWENPDNAHVIFDDADLELMLEHASRDAYIVSKAAPDDKAAATGCWFGGSPTLPPEIPWPIVGERPPAPDSEDYCSDSLEYYQWYPMHFIGQIDLAQLPIGEERSLPAKGTLFFFFDYVAHLQQQGCRVIYVDADVSVHPPRTPPEFPDDFDVFEDAIGGEAWRYFGNPLPPTLFKKWSMEFTRYTEYDVYRFPNEGFKQVALRCSQEAFRNCHATARNPKEPVVGPWGVVPQRDDDSRPNLCLHEFYRVSQSSFSPKVYDDRVFLLLRLHHDPDLEFSYSDWLDIFMTKSDLEDFRFDEAWAYTDGT